MIADVYFGHDKNNLNEKYPLISISVYESLHNLPYAKISILEHYYKIADFKYAMVKIDDEIFISGILNHTQNVICGGFLHLEIVSDVDYQKIIDAGQMHKTDTNFNPMLQKNTKSAQTCPKNAVDMSYMFYHICKKTADVKLVQMANRDKSINIMQNFFYDSLTVKHKNTDRGIKIIATFEYKININQNVTIFAKNIQTDFYSDLKNKWDMVLNQMSKYGYHKINDFADIKISDIKMIYIDKKKHFMQQGKCDFAADLNLNYNKKILFEIEINIGNVKFFDEMPFYIDMTYSPIWQPNHKYKNDDIVSFDGIWYKSKSNHTSGIYFDKNQFQQLIDYNAHGQIDANDIEKHLKSIIKIAENKIQNQMDVKIISIETKMDKIAFQIGIDTKIGITDKRLGDKPVWINVTSISFHIKNQISYCKITGQTISKMAIKTDMKTIRNWICGIAAGENCQDIKLQLKIKTGDTKINSSSKFKNKNDFDMFCKKCVLHFDCSDIKNPSSNKFQKYKSKHTWGIC